MYSLITSISQSAPFQFLTIMLIILFAIAVIETSICVAMAMCFNIREISGFRQWFRLHHDISSNRASATLRESKSNWFLWLSVLSGSNMITYESLTASTILSKIEISIKNALRFTAIFLLVPFYLVFTLASMFERFFRYVLGFAGLIAFWILANAKIIAHYYCNEHIIEIDSTNTDLVCSMEILYRKPKLVIILSQPLKCSDSVQKDNINHFISSLKEILPRNKAVSISTTVHYPGGENQIQADLPLTANLLQATIKKIKIKTKEEMG